MPPYNQIPEDRRTILDYSGRVKAKADDLGFYLAVWAARDDSNAGAGCDPSQRRCHRG